MKLEYDRLILFIVLERGSDCRDLLCEFGACGPGGISGFQQGGFSAQYPNGNDPNDYTDEFLGAAAALAKAALKGAGKALLYSTPAGPLLDCPAVNFVAAHPIAVGGTLTVGTVALAKTLPPQVSAAISIYAGVYVPIAQSSFCKPEVQ